MSDDAQQPPPLPPSAGGTFGGGYWIAAILLLLVGGGLFLPAIFAMRAARTTAMRSIGYTHLTMLETAIGEYQVDFGRLPDGNGIGSADLARALSTVGPRKVPYYTFSPGQLDPAGNIVSPYGTGGIVKYRNNVVHPGGHKPGSFDLSCPDEAGKPDEINNWTPP